MLLRKFHAGFRRSAFLITILFNYIYTIDFNSLKAYSELKFNEFEIDIINPDDSSSRSKRSISNSEQIEELSFSTTRLKFHAFNRDFVIFLKRDLTLVSENIDIEVRYSYKDKPDVVEHAENFFTSNNYIGFVEGEPKSTVICYLEKPKSSTDQPLLYAQIRLEKNELKKEYFYIEPLTNNGSTELNYIIYRNEDINSAVMPNGVFNSSVCKPKYADDLNEFNPNEYKNIVKRQIELKDKKDNKVKRKNRCSLALIADHKFFTYIGNSNVKQTTAYLLNIIGSINSIYTRTTWRFEDNTPLLQRTNYGFQVEKVIVLSTAEETISPHYNEADSPKDADQILQLFSRENWSTYCLAHLFTYAGFDNSVLGLAYVSSPLSYTLGGICSRQLYRGDKQLSLNIGLSSYKSVSQRQGRLLQREAELVTAHEFGHNWGSEHDPVDSECSPESGPGGGNYLMYAYSNQGHDRNNNLFSMCSINSISQVLKSKSECFTEERESYCGNGHVDAGEDCDPGFGSSKENDPCCTQFCKFKGDAKCSDRNHNCCQNCQIVKAEANYKCYSSPNYLECFESHSICNGLSYDCPTQKAKPKGSRCDSFDEGKCDSSGHCLSLCQQKGPAYSNCLCRNKEDKCKICCRFSPGKNVIGECLPYKREEVNIFGQYYYLSNGRPCIDGICNEKNVCEQKVKDYVTRFWKVIQKATVSGFVEFMKRNIVGSIIIISLSLWVPFSCCIHFCIDKRNSAMQKQRIQILQREIMQNRHMNVLHSQPAKSSNANIRDRLLIRTEQPPNDSKLSPKYI